mgnify:CR=1 FL=1
MVKIKCVIGGQYGSEGKGKVARQLCKDKLTDMAVRCGGPNSGHTVTLWNDEEISLQQLPTGVVEDVNAVGLSAGCLIDKERLFEEISMFDIGTIEDRGSKALVIDKNAVVIKDDYVEEEKKRKLGERVASTCTGTGEAVAKRAIRDPSVTLAGDDPELEKYTVDSVGNYVRSNRTVSSTTVIEGTQGFGLSVYHSPFYPKATSRDTTVSGFLSEVGISPFDLDECIMVMRTFPIRVGGNSGPMENEIDWETIRKESGAPHKISERTSVTDKKRRVGRFEWEMARKAFNYNKPTQLAIMGLDYLNYDDREAEKYNELSEESIEFLEKINRIVGNVPINFLGTGPANDELIDRRKD